MNLIHRVIWILLSILLVGCATGTPAPTPTPPGPPTLSVTRSDYFPTLDTRPLPTRDPNATAMPTYVLPTATATPQTVFTDPSLLPSAYIGTLPLGAIARLGQGELSLVELSPDGNYLAVGGTTGILVYDANFLDLRWSGRTPEMVRQIEWSKDSTHIVAGMYDGSVAVWDTFGGNRLFREVYQSGEITSLDWSPDGSFIAASAELGVGLIIDSSSGVLLHRLVRSDHPETGSPGRNFQPSYESHGINSMHGALSPDGLTYASIYEIGGGDAVMADNVIILWNTTTGGVNQILQVGQPGEILWSPDGKYISTGLYFDQRIQLIDAKTGQVTKTLLDAETTIFHKSDIAWSPDSSMIAIDVNTEGPTVVDVVSGEVIYSDSKPRYEYWSTSPTWTSDSNMIAFHNSKHQIQVVNVKTGEVRATVDGVNSKSGVISSDGGRYFGWTNPLGTTLAAWDVISNTIERSLTTGTYEFTALTQNPDEPEVAVHLDDTSLASGDERWLIWNTDLLVATMFGDKSILWHAESGAEVQLPQGTVSSVNVRAVSPDKSMIALSPGNSDESCGHTEIWVVSSGQRLFAFDDSDISGTQCVSSLAWSPDGKTLAVGYGVPPNGYMTLGFYFATSSPITLHNMENGERYKVFEGHTSDITGVAFSADGLTLISSSLDGTLIIWDLTQ